MNINITCLIILDNILLLKSFSFKNQFHRITNLNTKSEKDI